MGGQEKKEKQGGGKTRARNLQNTARGYRSSPKPKKTTFVDKNTPVIVAKYRRKKKQLMPERRTCGSQGDR